jgi:hypothetical protein
MGLDDPADQIQLSGPEAVIPGKPKWIDPKFQVLFSRST